MRNTKILELAQINTAPVTIAGCVFKVREPSALEMIRYRELLDEKEGGSKAHGVAFLFEKCVFNEDMTPAFDKDEAFAIAVGSSRVAMPLLTALLQWQKDKEEEVPKEVAPEETSSES